VQGDELGYEGVLLLWERLQRGYRRNDSANRVKEAHGTFWGGYAGYFQYPDQPYGNCMEFLALVDLMAILCRFQTPFCLHCYVPR